MDTAPESFRRSRPGAEGYDKDEVDRFVAQVQAALRSTPPTMAPWEVRDMVFHTQRVQRGYDEHDVDDFLDQAERALREAHGESLSDPHEEPAAPRATPVWVYAGAAAALLVVAVVLVLLLS